MISIHKYTAAQFLTNGSKIYIFSTGGKETYNLGPRSKHVISKGMTVIEITKYDYLIYSKCIRESLQVSEKILSEFLRESHHYLKGTENSSNVSGMRD